MAKPWGRIEVGHMRHPKFLALNGNAIALWDEGKDYCDEYHTDGIIPAEIVKTFRFCGRKPIAMLTTPCGPKPDGTTYAPLWEAHGLGYKMHDYLDHNDCREAVLARMQQADNRRQADRDRKAEWRRRKGDHRTVHVTTDVRQMSRGTNQGTATSPSRSTTETVPETSTTPNGVVTRARGDAPMDVWARELVDLYPAQGRCGVLLVERPLYAVLTGTIAGNPWDAWEALQGALDNHKRSHQWRVKKMIPRLDRWLTEGLYLQELPEYQGGPTPVTAAVVPTPEDWTCPHVEEHASRYRCEQATALGRPRKVVAV